MNINLTIKTESGWLNIYNEEPDQAPIVDAVFEKTNPAGTITGTLTNLECDVVQAFQTLVTKLSLSATKDIEQL